MTFPYDTRLPPDLAGLKLEIEAHAREFGLDFYETIFEVVEADDLNEIASYGGFPTRYPHWSFGMSYEELKKGYEYGLSKIYEMVINNDPCYAYLMRCNHTVDQKLVMAHVYGHCDFFKNNAYFGFTSRKMMDEMANHGVRIRRYVEKYGEDEVETFVDRCMSVDDLIDMHSTAIKRHEDSKRFDFQEQKEEEGDKLTRFQSKDYMSDYINPPEALRAEEEENKKKQQAIERSFPERPERDVLLFLIEFAPLKPWQRDVLSIIRDEAYYFAPQGQTKIINEGWACVVKDSLVFTDRGILRMGDLVDGRQCINVHDGRESRRVYDHARFENRATIRLRTRRGYEVEGSLTHRLLMPDGSWRRLDEFQLGNCVTLSPGPKMWARECVPLEWRPQPRTTLEQIADSFDVGIASVVACQVRGKTRLRSKGLMEAVAEYDQADKALGPADVTFPKTVNACLASVLGYFIANGHIQGHTFIFDADDEEAARSYMELVSDQFALDCEKQPHKGRWRVSCLSKEVCDLFCELGVGGRLKKVPDCILQSTWEQVYYFLTSYFDGAGYVDDRGVVLNTANEELSSTVQIMMLNFGILTSRIRREDGTWLIRIEGKSLSLFMEAIGFGGERKRLALARVAEESSPYESESWDDEVVAIEPGRAEVYDISVEETHRYAAQGFINHNSYWHSTIMTERALEAWECIDYADHHSGTMAMSRGRVNPYKLGIELLRDVERRWNTGQFGKEWEECDDLNKKRAWNLNLGLGRKKIFEVRKIHNDVTFIDTFLTPEFCLEHKLFSFAHNEPQNNYIIESREFPKVKQRLLFSLTNHGRPFIYVVDGNYKNRGELLLRHEYNGIELRMDRAVDTLANVQALWSRPVHLQTVVENKPVLISHDGTNATQKNLGEADDPRKHAATATK